MPYHDEIDEGGAGGSAIPKSRISVNVEAKPGTSELSQRLTVAMIAEPIL
jgi:hypothetical protein